MFKIKNGKLQLGKKEETKQEEQAPVDKPKEETSFEQQTAEEEQMSEAQIVENTINTAKSIIESEEEPQEKETFSEEVVVNSDRLFSRVILQFESGHLNIDFYEDMDLVGFLNDLDIAMKTKSIVKVEDVVINCDKVVWYKVEEWIDDGKEEE